MITKLTIYVEGIDKTIHDGLVKTLQFMAKPEAGKWTSAVYIEDVKCDGR